jgi:ATP-dependent helicase/DNAse subunit B
VRGFLFLDIFIIMKKVLIKESKNYRAKVSTLRNTIDDITKGFLEDIDDMYDEIRADDNLSQDDKEDHLTDLHLMSMVLRQLRRDI